MGKEIENSHIREKPLLNDGQLYCICGELKHLLTRFLEMANDAQIYHQVSQLLKTPYQGFILYELAETYANPPLPRFSFYIVHCLLQASGK